ncbi:MAG: SDR family NAD(P)-dependent oxidoreductase [Verrucomicrobiota bacterium]
MRKILLTGASSGIGLAITKLLVAKGYQVWGTSRSAGRMAHIEGINPIVLDLNSDQSIQEGWSKLIDQAGHVDVVINNAGSGYFGSTENMAIETERELINTLLHGPMLLSRLAVKHFRANESGLLINVSSVAGEFPMPFMACYSAAKAALICYTEALRLELAGESINVVNIKPGDIHTDFNDSMPKPLLNENDPYQNRVQKVWHAVDQNMKHAPGPELVAQVVLRAMQEKGKREDYYAGDFFQTFLAPLANRFLPRKVVRLALKVYYGLPL